MGLSAFPKMQSAHFVLSAFFKNAVKKRFCHISLAKINLYEIIRMNEKPASALIRRKTNVTAELRRCPRRGRGETDEMGPPKMSFAGPF
jgi:hypothetical protein